MAVGNIYFYLFTALLAVHFIFAEEQQGDPGHDENNRWSISFHSRNNTRRPPPFFSFLPNMGSCNYTSEPGFTCSGCNTLRVCLPNNVSISRNCGIFMPYCDNGRCASSPSASCNGTSSS